MYGGAPEGVGVLDENALDELVEEQAGAIDEFVQHSGRDQFGDRAALLRLGRRGWLSAIRIRCGSRSDPGGLETISQEITSAGVDGEWFKRRLGAPGVFTKG